jgi:hypothetical protein
MDEKSAALDLEMAANLAAVLTHRALELISARPDVIFIGIQLALVQMANQIYNEKIGNKIQEAIAKVTAEAVAEIPRA